MAVKSPGLDKWARNYDVLVQQQTEELKQWKTVLKPNVYDALSDWCELTNGPATPLPKSKVYTSGGLHDVPVGQELHHFVMSYGQKPKKPVDMSLL